jgi:hypothetical protein
MAESLRTWGGRLAGAPILCFSPRFRPPLRRATLERFLDLGVEYVCHDYHHRYSWYNFINKPLAMVAARDACGAANLVWLDADVVVLGEPEVFGDRDSDFAASLTRGDLATDGPSHRFDEFWRTVCTLFGLEVDDLPWVMAEGRRMRYCIQAGIFRVRRESALVDHYLRNLETLMDSRLLAPEAGLFFHETVALTLAPFTSGSSWSELPRSHNYVHSGMSEGDMLDELDGVRVLHYQGSLYPPHRDTLLSALRRIRPGQVSWLEERLARVTTKATPHQRLSRRILRYVRERKLARFLAGCRMIDSRALVGQGQGS